MKAVKLFHNPTAGDQQHTKERLIAAIESKGYRCRYVSTKKKGWKETGMNHDLLAIAGGDGTVRKVVLQLLDRKAQKLPARIGVIPLGTANNIARALNLTADMETAVKSWRLGKAKPFDVGKIIGLEKASYFLEGIGFGVFPNLINRMKKKEGLDALQPDEELAMALEELLEVIDTYSARECLLEIDGVDHSGRFLLVEVMNTPSIGPNLALNPMADPGDGEVEVIIIPEEQREKLHDYVQKKIRGEEEVFSFSALKGKDIRITWEGIHVHVDDKILKRKKPIQLEIVVKQGRLDFMVPPDQET